MNESTSPSPFENLLFVSRILIILLILAITFVIWNNNNRKLHESLEILSYKNPDIELLEKGALHLYQADNNFRYYIITYNRDYFRLFSQDIRYVSAILDTISLSAEQKSETSLAGLFERKSDVAQMLINLKRLTDSLLNLSLTWDTLQTGFYQMPAYDINKITNFRKLVTTDTLLLSEKKKSFLQKVKSLFKDEENLKGHPVILRRSESASDTTFNGHSLSESENLLLRDIHNYYLTKFAALADGRNRLNTKERELADINLRLISQMQSLFISLRERESESIEKIRNEAAAISRQSASRIAWISLLVFGLATVLYILIINNISKIKELNNRLAREQQQAKRGYKDSEGLLMKVAASLQQIASGKISGLEGPEATVTTSGPTQENTPSPSTASGFEIFCQRLNTYLSVRKSKPSNTIREFSPYQVFGDVTGKLMESVKKQHVNILCKMPVKEDVRVSGDKETLAKAIEFLTLHALEFAKRKTEICYTVALKKNGTTFRLLAELTVSGDGLVLPEKEEDLAVPFSAAFPEGHESGVFNLPIACELLHTLNGKLKISGNEKSGQTLKMEVPFEH